MSAGRLDGKVALITGAARGMGRSHALRVAQEGADVVAVDICADVAGASTAVAGPDDMKETVRLVEALDQRIVVSLGDVRDQAAMDAAVAKGLDQLGRLDIVVANAAITSFGHTWELTEEAWQDILDVNLTGTWHTVKAAIPAMIGAGRGGAIVLVNSVNGLKSGAGIGAYTASKHGAVGLMRTLARELGPYQIRVNTVHPTLVVTPLVDNEASLRRYLPEADNPTVEDLGALMLSRHALPVPWVEEVDISNAVLWLASDEARFVTGVTLPVDAGMLIQ